MLDIRNKEDVLSACILQCPIKKIQKCYHSNDIEGLHEKINCKKCKGTGYEVIFKEEK